MTVNLDCNIDRIIFTSPNMPSPQAAGLRSQIIPSETDLGTWYKSGVDMKRVAFAQNIYDTLYNLGIDRPVFGISGIITSDTLFIEEQTNTIYVDTDQTWSLSPPRNAYVDDNSWLTVTDINEYDYASDPPNEDIFLKNDFTSSGTLDSTRDIIINGCATYMEPYNYIFNTNQIYRYDPANKHYSLVAQCPYDVNYPTTMVGVSGTLYMFYLDTDNSLIKSIQYNTNTPAWNTNTNHEYNSTTSTLSSLKAVYLNNTIITTLKYSETSTPIDLYTYNYNFISDLWNDSFINTCGCSGIGNKAAAFSYIYKHNEKLRATGNQYYTPTAGGKFVTYEETISGTWSEINTINTIPTLYNTIDYAKKDNELYLVNTTEQMTLDLQTFTLEYVSNPPQTKLCTSTSGGVIVYNDDRACPAYIYSNNTFSKIPGDVIKTHKSSNLLFTDNKLYFIKNSVTNEISTVDTVSGTKSIIYTNNIIGNTPFLFNMNNNICMLQPDYGTLSTISGTTITTIKSDLDIKEHTAACSDNIDTAYFLKGKNYYLFYKFITSSGTITQLNNLPYPSSLYSSIEYYNNKIYYITSNKLYTYNTITEAWDTETTTLPEQINSKGIKITENHIYYCTASEINCINRLHSKIKETNFTPIPTKYHSSMCINGSDVYLQYNTKNITFECTTFTADEKIYTVNLNNISYPAPTGIPYSLELISNIEREVEFYWEISNINNITHYRVYRNETGTGSITYVGKTTTLSFKDTLTDRGKTYYYFVKACNEYNGTSLLSSMYEISVAGYPYKYSLTTSSWENRKKEINQLPNSGIYLWGNSNLTFENSVKINITFGEAYQCYITAWDDNTHITTDNILLSNECYRVAAVAFATKADSALTEPDIKAMYYAPQFNKILKGNDSYYGKFNINFEAMPNRYGAYIIFKPILINIPEDLLNEDIYEFKTAFHLSYT